MTIQVTSTTDAQEVVDLVMNEGAPKAEEKSAPESKETPEQKEASESDPEEKAKEDEKDESKDESQDDESEEESKDEAKPKKKGGFQRRIDKLNSRVSEAQKEADYWKRVALEKGAGDKEKADDKPTPKAQDGKPNPDQFETHAEYVEALADWKTDQKLKELKAKEEQERLKAEQQRLYQDHAKRVQVFAEKTEDFYDVLENVGDAPVSTAVQELLISSENGPELIYELAKNREEFERINALPPLAAARELGRLEAKLTSKAEEKPEPKKTTKAPAPIAPVGSKSGPVEKSIYDPNLTQKEYEALREKMRSA